MTTPVPTANLTWTPVTLNTDGSAATGITYNLYQGGTPLALVKVQSGLTTEAATVTAGLVPGTTVYFAVSAVEGGVESAQTTASPIAIPLPTPMAPTGLTITLSG